MIRQSNLHLPCRSVVQRQIASQTFPPLDLEWYQYNPKLVFTTIQLKLRLLTSKRTWKL